MNRIKAFIRREKEFTRDASHELRTPLTVVKGAAEIIDKDRCIGCGTSVQTCPMDIFRLDEASGQSKIIYPQDCCPKDSITISPVKYI